MSEGPNRNIRGFKYATLLLAPLAVVTGAVISGICVFVGVQYVKPQALGLLILFQSVSFVPLGVGIGHAISLCYENIQSQRAKLLLIGALAGFIYGGFAVFSNLGSFVGILCVGIILGSGTGKLGGSAAAGGRLAIGFIGLTIVLYALTAMGGDAIAKVVAMVLYPGVATKIYGGVSIIWFALSGYIVGVVVAISLWKEIR